MDLLLQAQLISTKHLISPITRLPHHHILSRIAVQDHVAGLEQVIAVFLEHEHCCSKSNHMVLFLYINTRYLIYQNKCKYQYCVKHVIIWSCNCCYNGIALQEFWCCTHLIWTLQIILKQIKGEWTDINNIPEYYLSMMNISQ